MSTQPFLSSPTPRVRRPRIPECGRSALVRIIHFHRRLSNEQFVTSKSLAAELGVTARTIKRDITFLRDELGAPVAWDPRTHTYTYTHHCDLLPLLRIEADEALALALAGRTFAAWRTSPLGRALASALEKIAPIVGKAVSLPVDAMRDLLFAPEDPTADAEHRHFALLLEAILRRRELRLVYQKPKTGVAPESRTVHPLHLAYLDHRWMLIAHDISRGACRNFVLARIQAALATGQRFEPPPDFDRARYLRGSLGRYTGDADHHVRVLLDAEVAPYLRERPWHASQTIAERASGEIEVSFHLNNLNDIKRRLLACGAHARVLAPAELRESIRASAAAMLANHSEEK